MKKIWMIIAALLLTGCAGHNYKKIEFFDDVFTFEYEMEKINFQYEKETHVESDAVYVSPKMELGVLTEKGGYRVELYDKESLDTLFGSSYDSQFTDWEKVKEYEHNQYHDFQDGCESVTVAGSEGWLTLAHGMEKQDYKFYSLWVEKEGLFVHVVVEGWLDRKAMNHIISTWEWK